MNKKSLKAEEPAFLHSSGHNHDQNQVKKIMSNSFMDLDIVPTAIIYCEANFTKSDGKTANGLIRHSSKFRILSVIDSEMAGLDSGLVLDNKRNGIPIYSSLNEAFEMTNEPINFFIYGLAHSNGLLSNSDRQVMLEAMSLGMNIVNGLHQYLNDDSEFIAASKKYGVSLYDIRRPINKGNLQVFRNIIQEVPCPRVAVMGTDCAIGKRTTAVTLSNALKEYGLKVTFIATGQTGVIQGAPYSLVIDSIPAQFCPGELEAVIHRAYHVEKPDIIIIEGQGALSHPAFSTSAMILRGSAPNAVILQHAPHRKERVDFADMPMPKLSSEIDLIERFSQTKVIGICINHEAMNDADIEEYTYRYSKDFSIPVTDALSRSSMFLVHMILVKFPHLRIKTPTLQ
ncbi:EBNA-1 nuclear protein [Pseudoalteromonas luteoviolacea CPMOR-2]|uniref:EBNA-1 nuclear protein n=1 Tax=Pseudoalteromonas luteoviolacea DSM 6061 TaxID=1365250 RepID=A0A166UVE8_9GAMM|nr:DUF1611 domain-containing protein [Pseudoalteromonas luteoviolacea]KZN30854.1 EBNA-1 nuclear protein [Pseudoalteromonas luteoviolacea DSM 6061]KZN53417.1 EBNA-1 nuclear protein [Pseudoalteromonas luteoviolacea CPMOR-2]MBE0386231.1 hypothetical protein [Pseudoalteromonas luteoviolacea DSM 6061]